MAATWPPWGVGRGSRTSWNACRKARPGTRDIARRKAQPAGRVWPTAAVAAGLVAVRRTRGRGRGGGEGGGGVMANKSPDWDEKISASRTRVTAMSNDPPKPLKMLGFRLKVIGNVPPTTQNTWFSNRECFKTEGGLTRTGGGFQNMGGVFQNGRGVSKPG